MTYCLTEDRRRAGCAWLTAHAIDIKAWQRKRHANPTQQKGQQP